MGVRGGFGHGVLVNVFNVVVESDSVSVSPIEMVSETAQLRLAADVVIVMAGDVCLCRAVGEIEEEKSQMNCSVWAAGMDMEADCKLRVPTAALSRSESSPYQ